MKKIVPILAFLFIAQISAQNSRRVSADQHFERLEYAHAIEDYLDDITKGKATDETFEGLAKSYENIANYKEAERYYRRLSKGTSAKPENILGHARTLKSIGKIDEYKAQMQRFINLKPNDPRATSYVKNIDQLEEKLSARPIYEVTPVDFNTDNSDFGAIRYGNKVYFASAKTDSRKKHHMNGEPLLDIYKAVVTSTGKVGPYESLSNDINTKYHEGIITQAKGGRVYFDRNNYTNNKFKKDDNGVNQLQIYYADLVNGKYEVERAPFNDDNFSSAHPALSPDGKTLYFVSDRPGGLGEGDIWKVSINSDGSFGTPQNLGATINTADNEVFPYVGNDGAFYFSSNGHSSFGGLDNFVLNDGKVENLGAPINTGFDDFSFKPFDGNKSGYLASNRGGESDDIYTFELLPPCEPDVTIVVTDEEGNVISDASLVVLNKKTDRSEVKALNELGSTTFTSNCDTSYQLDATAEGYENATQVLVVTTSNTSRTLVLGKEKPLVTEKAVILNPIYFDFDSWNIRPDAAAELDRLVQVMNENPTMTIAASSHTDERGTPQYNMTLSDKRAKSMRDYVIRKGINSDRISGTGKGETDPAVDCESNCSEEEHQLNRRSEFTIVNR